MTLEAETGMLTEILDGDGSWELMMTSLQLMEPHVIVVLEYLVH